MSLYYESHVTVEPVFDNELELMKHVCKKHGFRVADLLMQKRTVDTPARSRYDTFCTGRGPDRDKLRVRMINLLYDLQAEGFTIWRYKIESALLDSKYERDTLGVIDEANKYKGEVLSEV